MPVDIKPMFVVLCICFYLNYNDLYVMNIRSILVDLYILLVVVIWPNHVIASTLHVEEDEMSWESSNALLKYATGINKVYSWTFANVYHASSHICLFLFYIQGFNFLLLILDFFKFDFLLLWQCMLHYLLIYNSRMVSMSWLLTMVLKEHVNILGTWNLLVHT